MKSVSFNVFVLGLATALTLAACDRGDKQVTAPTAVLVGQCEGLKHNRGFNTDSFDKERKGQLDKTFGMNANEPLIRTYVQKIVADPKDIYPVNSNTIDLISTQKSESFAASQDRISVNLRCQELKADLVGPGIDIKDMSFIGVVSDSAAGIDVKKQILLAKQEAGVGQIRAMVGEFFIEGAKKDSAEALAVKSENERSVKTLKLSLSSVGVVNQQVDIIQRSGRIGDDKVELDSSVVQLLAKRLGDAAPAEITEFLKNSQVQPDSTGGNKPASQVTQQKTLPISENTVINLAELAKGAPASTSSEGSGNDAQSGNGTENTAPAQTETPAPAAAPATN